MANVTFIPAIKDAKWASQEVEKPKLKVCAYCRVSTESEEQASSYEAQVEHYTGYIKRNPEWEFAGIYADDGISGTNTKKRDEFNRMINDCMEGKIEMIITKSISRFARNTLDCLKYIRQLKDKNIPVFFEKENINTMDAKGEVMLTIMASLAQQESQSLSQNVKMGIQYRYQAGKVQVNHNKFLGYTKDAEGNLVIVPEEAEIIKRIYREFLEGGSLKDICESLMADGILTGAKKKKWIPSTVLKILSNEKYIGDALLQKTVTTDFLTKKRVVNSGIAPQYYVEGSHEAIISRDVFMRAQAEKQRRSNLRSGKDGQKKRSYSGKYALSGIVFCEKCGDIYRRVAWNNRGKSYTVWRCCARVEGGPSACDSPTMPEEELHAAIVSAINEVLGQETRSIDMLKTAIANMDGKADTRRITAIDDELAEIQKEIVRLATNKQSYNELANRIRTLREEKHMLLLEGASAKGRKVWMEDMIGFLDSQDGLIKEYDERLVRKLIERVTICEDKSVTVRFKSGTVTTVSS